MVVDLCVEDRHALPVRGQVVGVGVLAAFDQAVEPQPGKVVAHLVGGVGGAQEVAHLGAKAPMGEPQGVQGDTQGAEQGHDPRIAEPERGRPPAILGQGGLCDPLKGWALARTQPCPTRSVSSRRRLTARPLACSSSRWTRRRRQPRSVGELMTVSIRSARPSLRYCLTRECLKNALTVTSVSRVTTLVLGWQPRVTRRPWPGR